MYKHSPGIYDDLCTNLRQETDADAVIIIIVNGSRGNGISLQSLGTEPINQIPKLLERLIDQVRDDLRKAKQDD